VIDFKLNKVDRPTMASRFMKRLKDILAEENVTYDMKVVVELLNKHFPDYRRVLNELQRYSSSGTIDAGILANFSDVNMKELVSALREKDFTKMRSWVVNNMDNDANVLYRKFYDTLLTEVVQVPQLIILLHDYSYKAAFVSDSELNLVACLTEIMAACEMKS
jgi:uncharacterized protein (UPF0216 family)